MTLYNGFGTREGIEAPHSFSFKRRESLTSCERSEVQKSKVRAVRYAGYTDDNADARDVFCCVKTYMRDRRLQQAPLLILPRDRCERIQVPGPTSHIPVEISGDRRAKLERLAHILEKDIYGYYRAAQKIREMLRGTVPDFPALGWLGEAPKCLEALAPATKNIQFPHLPETSWHVQVRYHS